MLLNTRRLPSSSVCSNTTGSIGTDRHQWRPMLHQCVNGRVVAICIVITLLPAVACKAVSADLQPPAITCMNDHHMELRLQPCCRWRCHPLLWVEMGRCWCAVGTVRRKQERIVCCDYHPCAAHYSKNLEGHATKTEQYKGWVAGCIKPLER